MNKLLKSIFALLIISTLLTINLVSAENNIQGKVIKTNGPIQIDKTIFDAKVKELTNLDGSSVQKLERIPRYYILTEDFANKLDKIKNVVVEKIKLKDMLQKRTITNEKIKEAKSNQIQAKENYVQLQNELQSQQNELKSSIAEQEKCHSVSKSCHTADEKTTQLLKEHISTTLQTMQQTITSLQSQLQQEQSLSQEEASKIESQLQIQKTKLNSLNQTLTLSGSKEDIHLLWKEVLNNWNAEKTTLRKNIGKLTSSKINYVLVHMNILQNKLNSFETKFEDVELNQEITDIFEQFSTIVSEGQNLFEEANQVLDQNSTQEADAKFKEADAKFKEADAKFKEANKLLLTQIIPQLKKQISQKELEDFLKTNDEEEISVMNIEYEDSTNVNILIEEEIIEDESIENIMIANDSEEDEQENQTLMNAINPTNKKTIGTSMEK
ncbi:MAG: hypothetical protein PHU51_02100 [Candidatus Nanoarchaeia archaeon]|nr:hypothetical protein [Candidatus Nanoarchaeia archaeon]